MVFKPTYNLRCVLLGYRCHGRCSWPRNASWAMVGFNNVQPQEWYCTRLALGPQQTLSHILCCRQRFISCNASPTARSLWQEEVSYLLFATFRCHLKMLNPSKVSNNLFHQFYPFICHWFIHESITGQSLDNHRWSSRPRIRREGRTKPGETPSGLQVDFSVTYPQRAGWKSNLDEKNMRFFHSFGQIRHMISLSFRGGALLPVMALEDDLPRISVGDDHCWSPIEYPVGFHVSRDPSKISQVLSNAKKSSCSDNENPPVIGNCPIRFLLTSICIQIGLVLWSITVSPFTPSHRNTSLPRQAPV